ncbi:MAG: 3-dehydroquinate synthase [Blastocatellia bacterium]|nr:3-dehydroquinate synthase [Blastocatellia bacterium]
MKKLEVVLQSHSYPIFISSGLLEKADELISSLLRPKCHKAVLVSNQKVFELYGRKLIGALSRLGLKTSTVLISDGERFKTLRTVENIVLSLIEEKIERNDLLLALGGGVIGDIAGFASAIYLRGIDFLQIPTTLLAQIDSSIGGKTGVNHKLGKNLIGAFHQPKGVLIDPSTLSSLDGRELRSALQEAVKYGVIKDVELFDLLEKNSKELLAKDDSLLEDVIYRCCYIKAGVVSRDEKESGERRILNFGHTIGHALEAATRYKRFKHGEAVGYGIIGAAQIASDLNLLIKNDLDRIQNLVNAFGPLPKTDNIDTKLVAERMAQDKKAVAGRLVFILPDKIGSVIIEEGLPSELVYNVLKKILKGRV